jgi:hypothetical protein
MICATEFRFLWILTYDDGLVRFDVTHSTHDRLDDRCESELKSNSEEKDEKHKIPNNNTKNKNRTKTLTTTTTTTMMMMLRHLFNTNTGTVDIPVPLALHWTSPTSWAIVIFLCLAICVAVCIDWLFSWPTRRIPLKPERASAFAPHLVPSSDIDTIVIGSGSGGCAAANLLAQSGQKVLILEQHVTRTGGCTHSFRDRGCEWDTGLHYTSAAMGSSVCRPGAIMSFMTRGLQKWTPLADPYDQVLFPPDDFVEHETDNTRTNGTTNGTNGGPASNGTTTDDSKGVNGTDGDGYPNKSVYSFVRGADATVQSVLDNIDPLDRKGLKKQAIRYMDLCQRINSGFTALGSEYIGIFVCVA